MLQKLPMASIEAPQSQFVKGLPNPKGLLTKFLAIFQICLKLCMQVENDYTNEFPKFQVHKLCGSRDIYIQKRVIFGGKIC